MKEKRKKMLWLWLAIVFALGAAAFGVYEWMNARNFQIAGRIVSHVDSGRKEIALTFDDGPTDKTSEILAMLDDVDIKGTFFLTGDAIESHMDQAKAIVAAGHQVGNHSYSHTRMVLKSSQFIDDEIDKTNDLIRKTGYAGEIVFRPPYGKKLVLLPLALQRRDITTVMWSLEPDSVPDVAGDAQKIADYVTENARDGDIVLLHVMHDNGKAAREAIPIIVDRLRNQGYSFVTVSELTK